MVEVAAAERVWGGEFGGGGGGGRKVKEVGSER